MIVFDLACADGHRFEGWFGSSADYAEQLKLGLIACPTCGSSAVTKAPMAPAVPSKSNTKAERVSSSSPAVEAPQQLTNSPVPPQVQKAFAALAKAQAEALKASTWVGDKFAEAARKMHYGERAEVPIHGQATLAEAAALIDEGVPVAPLSFPVAPPGKLN